MPEEESNPHRRSELAVEGVAFGDAFGEKFFERPDLAGADPDERELPAGPWRYTDDTVMALGIHQMFVEEGEVVPDRLAEIFAARFDAEPWRGYGPNARRVLQGIARGRNWRELSESSFGGEGSFGNGGAMRVAPVGAFRRDDYEAAVREARETARITHAHPEGVAGAVAVAVAAAAAGRTRDASGTAAAEAIFDAALEYTPTGETREGIARARALGASATVRDAVDRLGSGQRVTAMDTVPFVIWSAANWCDNLREALWRTAAGLGDRDTTCAMVGGIVALRTGIDDLPSEWFERREALDWTSEMEEHP